MIEKSRFCLRKGSIGSHGPLSTEGRAMASAPPHPPESSRGRESADVPACSSAACRRCSLSISAVKSMFRVSSQATQTPLHRAHAK
eukprot:5661697-Pyramimonas_sp.AAC.1